MYFLWIRCIGIKWQSFKYCPNSVWQYNDIYDGWNKIMVQIKPRRTMVYVWPYFQEWLHMSRFCHGCFSRASTQPDYLTDQVWQLRLAFEGLSTSCPVFSLSTCLLPGLHHYLRSYTLYNGTVSTSAIEGLNRLFHFSLSLNTVLH